MHTYNSATTLVHAQLGDPHQIDVQFAVSDQDPPDSLVVKYQRLLIDVEAPKFPLQVHWLGAEV